MWGAPGAVLSTPMLAITKIICDRIRPLMAFGHFMYGSQRAVLAPTDDVAGIHAPAHDLYLVAGIQAVLVLS